MSLHKNNFFLLNAMHKEYGLIKVKVLLNLQRYIFDTLKYISLNKKVKSLMSIQNSKFETFKLH